MNDVIGVIDLIEDDNYNGKEFKKVTLKNGQVVKVKWGREGFLKAKWGELEEGRAFQFQMGEYKGNPFVEDFYAVEGALPDPVAIHVEEKAMPKPRDVAPQKLSREQSISKMNGLNNSTLLASNGMVSMGSIGTLAHQFERYTLGEINADELDKNIKALLD